MKNEQIIILMSDKVPREKPPFYRVIFSFIVRDFKIWWTYKFWLTLDVSGTIILVATYYLFSLITNPQTIQEAGFRTGGYFTFALIGIAFQQYVFFSVQSINQSIRDEQRNGTMEIVLSSATDFRILLLGETCFYFIVSSAFLFISLFVGSILGARFCANPASILSAIILSLMLIVSHLAIGILGAAIVMKTKQGDPLTWAFSWMTQLVSGVFYPLNIIPCYLEWIGRIFPLTYALQSIRLCLQSCESLASPVVLTNMVYLGLFIIIATPLALIIFKKGYDAARKDGSLGQY